jgi:hypothetical protein
MLQHLKWRSLEDRRRDARLVMMYKISHDKVAVSKSDIRSSPDGLTIDWYACSLTEVEPMFSLIGLTTNVVDVAFPFRVLADCYSQIFCLINRFQDMTVKAIIEFYRCFIT